MNKVIDIEYCGQQGFGGPALRLKKALLQAFPNAEINTHAATGKTGRIQVAWVVQGAKKIVWSNGKTETQGNYQGIIENLKSV